MKRWSACTPAPAVRGRSEVAERILYDRGHSFGIVREEVEEGQETELGKAPADGFVVQNFVTDKVEFVPTVEVTRRWRALWEE